MRAKSGTMTITALAAILFAAFAVGCTFTGAQADSAPPSGGSQASSPSASDASYALPDIETVLSQTILDANADGYYTDDNCFCTESHTILRTVEEGGTATVYLWARYAVFTSAPTSDAGYEYVPEKYAGLGFYEIGGSHIPMIITITADGSGYSTTWWSPGDGSLYETDIKEHFPADLYDQALDGQAYIERENDECYAKASEYFSKPLAS